MVLQVTREALDRLLYGPAGGAQSGPFNAVTPPARAPTLFQVLNNNASHDFQNRPLPYGLKIAGFPGVGKVCCGVFCYQRFIKQGTRFGPYEGRIARLEALHQSYDNDYMWEVFVEGTVRYYIDGKHDPTNWMKFINCARSPQEQNLCVIQLGLNIFYEANKDIRLGEELRVWYGEEYNLFMGIPTRLSATKEQGCSGYPCEQCGKIFAYEYYRDRHLKYTRCVDQGDRRFPCFLCHRSFDKRDRLRIHVLHVHEKYRPHACHVCSKRFSQSSSLKKHMRVHSGERPYKCPYCVKAFTASSILRTHIRQHSGEKPFKCKHCRRAFASHAAHDSHVRRTHTNSATRVQLNGLCFYNSVH